MPLCSAICGSLQGRSCKYASRLTLAPGFEPEGRGFRSAKDRLDIARFASSRIPFGVPLLPLHDAALSGARAQWTRLRP